jgi:hypothetical protein
MSRRTPTHLDRKCHFCGETPTLTGDDGKTVSCRLINGPHYTGAEYTRVDYCPDCAGGIARAPRRPRGPRRPAAVRASDWNQLVVFTASAQGVTPPARRQR